MEPDNIRAVHLGIASHNLFELAYAALLARENKVTDCFYFEMLEGMADHVRRALQEDAGDVLLYAPVAARDEFINGIAYLLRRLDENTSPENFLRYSPDLDVRSEEWAFLKETFLASCALQQQAQNFPNRIQDRSSESFDLSVSTLHRNSFVNEPDTDWSLAANRVWAENIRSRWMKKSALVVPLVIDGEERVGARDSREVFDPGQYPAEVCVGHYMLASEEDARDALRVAREDADDWRRLSVKRRQEVLTDVAMELRAARGKLIGAAAADTGKLFTEADVEVSEAIDFAEFYPYAASRLEQIETIETKGKGVGLVISPWNFPIAIPCGGIVAALAAGNTVIFKPASDAVLAAWELCKCFWRAGVSKKSLQFVPCSGAEVGPLLTSSEDVDFIILTGGTDTGLEILKQTPSVYLAAETGGKNATIVTEMADRDQAIKNVLHSAFSNSGQKCSATSLLILEKTIYDDPRFKQQLKDAAQSMKVGAAWDFRSKIGPLAKVASGDLRRGLEQLEPGEEWLLKPDKAENNLFMWTPGIKYGVRPGSYSHMTEFFGPLLGVMRAKNLDHAIELVNQTGYGLTSGLESLDEREQRKWKESIKAGNLYINRGTTGAIVQRQPFGGMGKSALGPGLKAGNENYVSQFMQITEEGYPKVGVIQNNHRLLQLANEWTTLVQWQKLQAYREDITRTIRALWSYLYAMETVFGIEADSFHLRGQDNILRYLPLEKMMIRVHEQDSLFETLGRIGAAEIAGGAVVVSLEEGLDNEVSEFLQGRYGKQFLGETPLLFQRDEQLIAQLGELSRIRYGDEDRVPAAVYAAAAQSGFYISRTPVYMEGRIELLQYFQQQAICDSYHRYGNLGERELEWSQKRR